MTVVPVGRGTWTGFRNFVRILGRRDFTFSAHTGLFGHCVLRPKKPRQRLARLQTRSLMPLKKLGVINNHDVGSPVMRIL